MGWADRWFKRAPADPDGARRGLEDSRQKHVAALAKAATVEQQTRVIHTMNERNHFSEGLSKAFGVRP